MDVVVFTNGCFDIIHPGHIDLLKKARSLGTKLIVGINSDRSVREIKGASRPFLDQESRTTVLKELRSVSEVRIFDENTPEDLIREIKPDILVKGGDWKPEQIIGADFVTANGGKVFSIPFKQNISTTQIVEKIQTKKNPNDNGNIEKVCENAEKSLSGLKDFEESEISNVKRAADIISDVLRNKGKIIITSITKNYLGAFRLNEDLQRYFGPEKILFLEEQEVEEISGAGDLLIGVGGSETSDDFAGIIMKAKKKGSRIIILNGINGRKLAALSDACVMSQSMSVEEILLQQAAIGYLWYRAIKV